MKLLIDVYHLARRVPVSRYLLRLFGPLFHATAQKPDEKNSGRRAE